MKIKQIAQEVAFYLRTPRTKFIDEFGNDVIITALNDARKRLEQMHDFVYCQQSAWLDVAPDIGASLEAAKLVNANALTNEPLRVKAVDLIYLLVNNQVALPIWHDTKRRVAVEMRELNESQHSLVQRYFSSPPTTQYGTYNNTKVYFNGPMIRLDPTPKSVQRVLLDCQAWLPDYQSDLVQVEEAETSSQFVTLAVAPPANFKVGSVLLGQKVVDINGLVVELGGNAKEEVAFEKSVMFINPPSLVLSASEQVGGDYEDWFTDKAAEYLKWSAVVDVNNFVQQFVYRAEGYLSPPEKARDAALQSVIWWDDYQWQQGLIPGGDSL